MATIDKCSYVTVKRVALDFFSIPFCKFTICGRFLLNLPLVLGGAALYVWIWNKPNWFLRKKTQFMCLEITNKYIWTPALGWNKHLTPFMSFDIVDNTI